MRLLIALTSLVCAAALAPTAQAFSGAALPNGWFRVPWRITSTTVPVEVYAAASFPLHRTPPGGCGPSTTVRAQMPQNSVIVIVDSWGQLGENKQYRPFRHVRLGRAANLACLGWAYNIPFRAGSEDLQAFVLVKGRPGAVRLNQARHLLASVRQ